MVLTIAFAISSLSCYPLRALRCLQPHLIDEYKSNDFCEHLVNYMTSGPVYVSVWSGDYAVKPGQQLAGTTNPLQADSGSMRGRYCPHEHSSLLRFLTSCWAWNRLIFL